ncbi:MAG: hypothetical protein WBE77_15495 [Candidatus Cybelea sp.]
MSAVQCHEFQPKSERLGELALADRTVGEPLEHRRMNRRAPHAYRLDPFILVAAQQLAGIERMRAEEIVRAAACSLEELGDVGNHGHVRTPRVASPNAADRIYPEQRAAEVRASAAHGDVQAMGSVLTFESRIEKLDEAIARYDNVSMQREILNEAPAAHRRRTAFPTLTNENA